MLVTSNNTQRGAAVPTPWVEGGPLARCLPCVLRRGTLADLGLLVTWRGVVTFRLGGVAPPPPAQASLQLGGVAWCGASCSGLSPFLSQILFSQV